MRSVIYLGLACALVAASCGGQPSRSGNTTRPSGLPGSARPSVTATVSPAGPTPHASDDFGRTVDNGWGGATVGGGWTLAGTAADFHVTGTAGTMALPASRAYRAAFLNTISVTDVDLTFRVATSKTAAGGPQYIYSAVRRVSAGNFYRVTMRIEPNGKVFVGASTVIDNTETGIGSEVRVAQMIHGADAFIRLRAQLSGTSPTSIRVRAWADGATEPSSWQYTATNSTASLQVAGEVGLESYLSRPTTNAPVIVTFDDYLATGVA